MTFPKDRQRESPINNLLSKQPSCSPPFWLREGHEERTLLYNRLPSDVSDGEHGIEYVTGKEDTASVGAAVAPATGPLPHLPWDSALFKASHAHRGRAHPRKLEGGNKSPS